MVVSQETTSSTLPLLNALRLTRCLLRTISEQKQVRVHDSNADLRYLVLPQRPDGTDGWDQEKLARLVTRDAMIGVSDVLEPTDIED